MSQIDRAFAFRSAFMDATGSGSARESNGQTALLKPLEDAVALFDELQICYALVGGIAAMNYGRSRFAEVVDFVASAPHRQFLADHPDIMRKHHFDSGNTWKLYHDSGIEIDIWKDEFSDQIAARARTIPFHNRMIRIAEVHDLLAMKLRANRPQDDYDISEIIRKTPVDVAHLQRLVTPEELSRFQAIKTRIGA
jgi:hypothetical protein